MWDSRPDYDDDFTKAVTTHYPPLIRLLITKGGRQNTQDARGDTPMMLAIRSHDREIVDLLANYQPDYTLQNLYHHTAAIEAVLADDPDSLKISLSRDDSLQVAQATALARKFGKRRAYNKLVEILGAYAANDLSGSALESPLRFFSIGNTVSFAYSPTTILPDVCGIPSSIILFQGKVCRIDGETISVKWDSISNINNNDMKCSRQHHFRIERKTDDSWNTIFLGSCGVAPTKFNSFPNSFNYRQFVIPELALKSRPR